MRLAVIGLGRMGANISRRLLRAGHDVVGFNRNQDKVRELISDGLIGASSLEAADASLDARQCPHRCSVRTLPQP